MPVSVAVCICTCRRPVLLRRALEAIARQDFSGAIRVVVMENHAEREGSAVCETLAATFPFPLEHGFEPRPGLAYARNAALQLALGQSPDFIAMIDDDEWPEPDWLSRLMAAQAAGDADIVAGPAEPVFEVPPPYWIVRGGYFQRTGESYSTGNIVFRGAMLRAEAGCRFNPQLNFTGHEDHEMVWGLKSRGYTCRVSEDAIVHEWVPAARSNLRYILARGLREGNADIFVPELRGPGMRLAFARLGRLVMKFLYALNHLLWSPFQPWRFFRALDDLASCSGMMLGLLNYRYLFYAAQQGSPRRFVKAGNADRLV